MDRIKGLSLLTLAAALIYSASLSSAPVLPTFSAENFAAGAAINHPYFPLTDNLTRVYVGQRLDAHGQQVTERFELTPSGVGPIILGVPTTSRRDRAFVKDQLREDTLDYFAQDKTGNVWYFGEDVTNYIYDTLGNLLSTHRASSWRAGINGAMPGLAMPRDLTVGFEYFQESAPTDHAVDVGMTSAHGLTVRTALGTYTEVLRVLETNALEPDTREFKYYAPGVGLIRVDEDLDPSLTRAEFSLELITAMPSDSRVTQSHSH